MRTPASGIETAPRIGPGAADGAGEHHGRLLVLTDLAPGRSWVVRTEDGHTCAEMLDIVPRLAWTDLDHLEFADPMDEKRFHELVDPKSET